MHDVYTNEFLCYRLSLSSFVVDGMFVQVVSN